MPHNKKQGIALSLIMIYIMAVLNMDVRLGRFAGESWLIALPLQMLLAAPLSLRLARRLVRD